MTNADTPPRDRPGMKQDSPGGRATNRSWAGTDADVGYSRQVQGEPRNITGRIFFKDGICEPRPFANDDYTRLASAPEFGPAGMGKTDDPAPEKGSLRDLDLFWIVPGICLVWAWMILCDLVMGSTELFDNAITARAH